MSETPTPKPPARVVRMWHRRNDDWCHAWDVEESAFRTWKENGEPPASTAVFLPNGRNPVPFTQVVCGTCKSAGLAPPRMRAEFMRR